MYLYVQGSLLSVEHSTPHFAKYYFIKLSREVTYYYRKCISSWGVQYACSLNCTSHVSSAVGC